MTSTRLSCTLIAATVLGALVATAATKPSQAGDCGRIVNHNGSSMALFACGDGPVDITYERPRSGMRREGVSRGTLLFDGHQSANHVEGTARVFKRGCAPATYEVEGSFSGSRLTLYGRAPVRNSNCEIVRYRRDVLVFN